MQLETKKRRRWPRRAPLLALVATIFLSFFGGLAHAEADASNTNALGLSWKGYADTDLRFSEFFGAPHTIVLRFMPQFPTAYDGPLVAENGSGTFAIGQDDFLTDCDPRPNSGRPCKTRLFVAVGAQAPATYPAALVAGRWYHLAVTVDGRAGTSRNVTLYLDGSRLGSPLTVAANDPQLPSGTLRFGRRTTGRAVRHDNAQFYGFIDDVGVFTRKLKPAQISSLSASTSELTGSEQRLLAGYTFNDGAMPANLSRPLVLNGAAELIPVSPNRDATADAAALPLPSRHAEMSLPFAPGDAWYVVWGYGQNSHIGFAGFCWDFIIADKPDVGPYPNGSDGAPLYSAAPGRVVTVHEAEAPGTGRTNIVEVEHAPGEFYGYLHLRQNTAQVAVGDQLDRGQKIGLNGNTGMPKPAEGHHLHFGNSDRPSGPFDRLGSLGGVTFPIAFSNYEVRNPDGTWRHVARGIPKTGEVVRVPPLVGDPGFESQTSWAISAPWEGEGPDNKGIDLNLGFARSGRNNAWIRPANTGSRNWNAIKQTVAVTPNTDYVVSAYIRNSDNFSEGYFGVRHGTSTNVLVETRYGGSPGYTKLVVPFNSGSNRSVTVFAGYWAPGVDSWIQLDDVTVRKYWNLADDPGFESQPSSAISAPWQGEGPDTKGIDLNLGQSHLGLNNAWIHPTNTGTFNWNAIKQTVPVSPNTDYVLTGYVRMTNNFSGGFFGVRHGTSGNVLAERNFGALGGYLRLTVTFNSGSNTSVTTFAGYWAPGVDSWLQLDDVSLFTD